MLDIFETLSVMLYSSLCVGDVRVDYLRFLNGKNLFFHFKYAALGEFCSLTTTYPRVYMLLLFVLLERFLLLMCLCCVCFCRVYEGDLWKPEEGA